MTFRTMLAAKAPAAELIQYPVLASPKLDGVRNHIINGQPVSRNLKPFGNSKVNDKFRIIGASGLDGELIYGDPTSPTVFRNTMSHITREGADVTDLKFFVFDDFTDPSKLFYDRLSDAEKRVRQYPGMQLVDHDTIRSVQELNDYESQMVKLGYEGIMVRSLGGKYKYGRSTVCEGWLMKVKRFEDADAVVVGYEEKMHNANEKTLVKSGKATRSSHKAGMVPMNTLGALIVYDTKTQVEFNVGSGFDDAERSALWSDRDNLNKRIIKYRYFAGGSKDKPRFPTFLGFRDDL